MSSGGLGGLTFPFVITPLNETLGVSWYAFKKTCIWVLYWRHDAGHFVSLVQPSLVSTSWLASSSSPNHKNHCLRQPHWPRYHPLNPLVVWSASSCSRQTSISACGALPPSCKSCTWTSHYISCHVRYKRRGDGGYMQMLTTTFSAYATQLGLSTTQGSSLVSITAGATFIGRLTVG